MFIYFVIYSILIVWNIFCEINLHKLFLVLIKMSRFEIYNTTVDMSRQRWGSTGVLLLYEKVKMDQN